VKFKYRYITVFSLLAVFVIYLLIHYSLLMLRGAPAPAARQRTELAERGSILDRNGRILAIQIRFADVSVWKPSITDINVLSNEISAILDMTPAEIRERINSSVSNFVFLKRQIDDVDARRLSSLLEEKKIDGVRVQPMVGRVYPERKMASQIIGFVGDTNEGIEFAFNDILNGSEASAGSHVVLTIDTYVQHILEEIALRTMNDTGAEAVMFAAMDPRTGDILGSASLPDFDPNNFRSSDSVSRMNRPAIWAFEPGSTFKVFSIAALLDSGAISGNSVFVCNGVYNPARGAPINCMGIHGRVTAREIIINSCNAGAAYASDNITNSAFYKLLSDFGFGSRTGAGGRGETAGYFVSSANWSDRSKPTIAFGQEIAVSALQILQATSVIANDGILVPPRIVLRTVSADGKTSNELHNGERRRVISEQTARAMRSYMVDTASSGAMGWRAAVRDMSLGVKTGTAQLIDPVTRGYSETDFISSCVALFPADNPTLILYLAIVKPKGEIFGTRIAAPAIREAAESLIDYLGIPRGRNPQVDHPPSVNIPAARLPALETHVPDFTGLSKRTLMPLLLRGDIMVEIRGDGWVCRQNPPAGTPVTDGMTIILELE